MAAHPYDGLPGAAFWRSGVAGADPAFLPGLYTPRFRISRDDRIGTAGSCFAQHVGAALTAAGYTVPIIEHPLPEMEAETQRRFGFGLYPARYGNIYTARQLRQLIEDCLQTRTHPEAVWEKDGRFFDALRPSVEPFGMESADDVIRSRRLHLQRVCDMMHNIDVLIFTLGLTETWEEVATGLVYPTCPGVIAGRFDPRLHAFRTLSFGEVLEDMKMVIHHLRAMAPGVRFLLTVSPGPLTATASGGHVLAATARSKAVLRAVADEIVARNDCADYFPSYEIVTNPAARGRFFAPNLRSVTAEGVAVVMRHFLDAHEGAQAGAAGYDAAVPLAGAGSPASAAVAAADEAAAGDAVRADEAAGAPSVAVAGAGTASDGAATDEAGGTASDGAAAKETAGAVAAAIKADDKAAAEAEDQTLCEDILLDSFARGRTDG